MNQENYIRRYFIVGERRFSNYWWATVICIGSFGFLLTGISSYIMNSMSLLSLNSTETQTHLSWFYSIFSNFNSNTNIHFFPQGLINVFLWQFRIILLSLYLVDF